MKNYFIVLILLLLIVFVSGCDMDSMVRPDSRDSFNKNNPVLNSGQQDLSPLLTGRDSLFLGLSHDDFIALLTGRDSLFVGRGTLFTGRDSLFTGRDSLFLLSAGKIALFGKVSGTLEETSGECSSLSGFGHVTHFGLTTIEEDLCIDGKTLTGTFTYTGQAQSGRSGKFISGSYEGTLIDGNFEAEMIIENVSHNALQETPPDGEEWGKAVIKGKLNDSYYTYEVLGWLFHHDTDDDDNSDDDGDDEVDID